jgi:hypothetical protein
MLADLKEGRHSCAAGYEAQGAVYCCWVCFQGIWWASAGAVVEGCFLPSFGDSWPPGKQAELWGSNLNVNDLIKVFLLID